MPGQIAKRGLRQSFRRGRIQRQFDRERLAVAAMRAKDGARAHQSVIVMRDESEFQGAALGLRRRRGEGDRGRPVRDCPDVPVAERASARSHPQMRIGQDRRGARIFSARALERRPVHGHKRRLARAVNAQIDQRTGGHRDLARGCGRKIDRRDAGIGGRIDPGIHGDAVASAVDVVEQ